jgi:antitoxin ParD1/3/4
MPKTTSISLGPHFDRFVSRQVARGRFATASEVVRAGLRLLEEDDAKLAALRCALDEGEASGLVEDFDIASVIREVAGRRRR